MHTLLSSLTGGRYVWKLICCTIKWQQHVEKCAVLSFPDLYAGRNVLMLVMRLLNTGHSTGYCIICKNSFRCACQLNCTKHFDMAITIPCLLSHVTFHHVRRLTNRTAVFLVSVCEALQHVHLTHEHVHQHVLLCCSSVVQSAIFQLWMCSVFSDSFFPALSNTTSSKRSSQSPLFTCSHLPSTPVNT